MDTSSSGARIAAIGLISRGRSLLIFMGIDIHAVNFIKYVSKRRRLGRVATIGRQALVVPKLAAQFGGYCEEFLIKNLGAELVDSYDFSDYEGATHIVDMNQPLIQERRYDTIIDCGCLEHVYNAPQAFKNVSCLCDVGGQIIHVLPANNFCGHGFWQFSPELFFSLYSDPNGYIETEVFLAGLENSSTWYAVVRPMHGERAEVTSKSPVYVMCRTVKSSNSSHDSVQQSDYVQLWNNAGARTGSGNVAARLKAAMKKRPRLYRYALALRETFRDHVRRMRNPTALSNRNRHLKKCDVSDLLAG
jgi:hypothetical protein